MKFNWWKGARTLAAFGAIGLVLAFWIVPSLLLIDHVHPAVGVAYMIAYTAMFIFVIASIE